MKNSNLMLYGIIAVLIFGIFFLLHKPVASNISNRIITFNENSIENPKEEKLTEEINNEINPAKNPSTDAHLFKLFLNKFPSATFPLVFDKNFFKAENNDDTTTMIGENYYIFLPESGTSNKTEAEIYYKPIGKIFENEKIVALVYSRTIKYNEVEKLNGQKNTFVNLAVYNKNGKSLREQNIAYSSNYEDYLFASINKGPDIQTKRYVFIRQKDVEKYGYDNNPIKSEVASEEVKYTLTNDGEIKILSQLTFPKNLAAK